MVNTMNTQELDKVLEAHITQWTELVGSLKDDIGDDYRASEEEDVPGMCLTVGGSVKDGEFSWAYQTGDNSYSGGAYCHKHWAVVSIYRDSDPAEIAKDIANQLGEAIGSEMEEPEECP